MNLHLNPYKFRLMLDSLDDEFLNGRQRRLLLWLLFRGRKGCDSYNYRIAKEMKCSVRTVQYDLRRLEKLCLIEIKGALGKHRKIVVIPYPNKATWAQNCMAQVFRKKGANSCTHQRCLKVKPLNSTCARGETPQEREEQHIADNLRRAAEQRQRLLYGPQVKVESAKTADRVLPGGCRPQPPARCSEGYEKMLEIRRQNLIEDLIRKKWPRERAISIANARIDQLRKRHRRPVEARNGKTGYQSTNAT